MNGFSTPQEPFGGNFFDRSPLGMPCTEARMILQMASIKLKQLGADKRSLGNVALGDALENLAGGETEAACQAAREAEAYRGIRA